jgi:cytochrome b561
MTTDTRPARSRYSTIAIALHWTIAAIVIGNLAGGLLLETFLDSPDKAMQAIGAVVIDLHKSFGLTVLLLTFVRIGWRLANPPPPLPAYMTRGEVLASRAVHHGFYALLLLIPLSGWALASTDKVIYPLVWFWLVPVAHLPLPKSLGETFAGAHQWLAYGAIALIVLHVAAALKHQYFDRDNLLARMWPSRP